MVLLKIFVVGLLLTVLIQDITSRSVSWPVFPFIALCGLTLQWLLSYPLSDTLRLTAFNLLFLMLQFLGIRLYFLITRGQKAKVVDKMIGWGDILFLISVAFFLPVTTFIAFYILSLLLVLTGWLLYLQIIRSANRHIPLAGLQALIFILFLAGDWLFGRYDIYDDQLFTFLTR
ncbi:hypothetical protein ACFQZI_14860 [Mucilaginibacter lutimaris]|uniref:Type IV leader peptidase family protein n=1 Tax=Mucilaginibacter lutimaris TaxID=931629 RepID=A0ABW2ZJ57_9SPHI